MSKEQLAIEITYASSKEVKLSVDDWIKKIEKLLKKERKEEYKRGFNQRLKEEGKVGEKYMHLYL